MKESDIITPQQAARLIDHTLLRPDATEKEVEMVCRDAVEFGFAAVCINPVWISLAARLLEQTGVAVCTVVAFPLGAITTDMKAFEAQRAITEGAREIDVVINIGELKSGNSDAVRRDLAAVVDTCRQGRALSKAIIETALLTDPEKTTACMLAKAAGADFVKTSTGFAAGGATVQDVRLIRGVVGEDMGVKASGGIRDLATVRALTAAGATRIGTSAGVAIVRQARGRK